MKSLLNIVKFIYSIRKFFLVSGLLITLIGLFLPLFDFCFGVFNDEPATLKITGYSSFVYQLTILFLAILILLTKVLRFKSGTIIWVLSIIFITIIQGYTKIGTAGFGRSCGSTPTAYLYFAQVGNLLVVFWAILTSMRNQLSPKVKNSSVLLDDQIIEH